MQVHFSISELQLLADTLENALYEVSQQMRTAEGSSMTEKRAILEGLVDKLIDRDMQFSCDELDTLVEILSQQVRTLKIAIAQNKQASVQVKLQHQRELLQPILDRVTEACAMA